MSVDAFVRAIQEARPGGAAIAGWSVWSAEGIHVSLPTKDGQTGNAHTPLSVTDGAVIRYKLIWDDGMVSRGAVERFGVDSRPGEILEQARGEAIPDADSAYVLHPAPLPDVELFDPATARVVEGDLGPWSGRLARIRAAIRVGRFRTWSASLRASATTARLVTSSGIDASASSTVASWWVSLDGEYGDGNGGRALEPDGEFERRLERTAEIASLMRVPHAGGTAGVRAVILHPRVVAGLLLESLIHHLDGKTVARKEGWFRKEQFGGEGPVLREDLTVRVDPLVPLQLGSYRFTQDGLPAARCELIRAGRLVTPLTSLKYARVLGIPPTPLPAGVEGLHVDAGPRMSLAQAYEAAAGGALVLDVLGLHTLDQASGDFSLAAPQTLALGAGGPAGRFRATISGNLLELLRADSLRWLEFPGENHPGALVQCRLDPR